MHFLEKFFPGYFAYIMATEILSVALFSQEYFLLSGILHIFGAFAYLLLIVLYGMRLILFPRIVMDELFDPRVVFHYFTFVAGTNTLAIRCGMSGEYHIAFTLGIIALVILIPMTYAIFSLLIFSNQKTIENIVDASWLLLPIALQSQSYILTNLISQKFLTADIWLLLAYGLWSFGLLIYLIFIIFLLYRLFFFPLKGNEISPAYWTFMGAAAISVVAGSGFLHLEGSSFIENRDEFFIREIMLIVWFWGTAWIPVLVLMVFWKYGIFKEIFAYHPSLWAMVFPLGMYTIATKTFLEVAELPALDIAITCLLWLGVFSWALISASFLHSFLIARSNRQS